MASAVASRRKKIQEVVEALVQLEENRPQQKVRPELELQLPRRRLRQKLKRLPRAPNRR
jgi:uncharacterized sporulation protein YeaH/YhbH (DUF444 family)